MKYQTNPTRAEAIWLDVTKRNPKRDDETFAEWLERLTRVQGIAIKAGAPHEYPDMPRAEQVEGGQG